MFDRDDHESYFNALSLAKSLDGNLRNDKRKPISFKAIAPIPSFELWLLLHYEDIQAPIHRDEVMARLKQHMPAYDKGAGGTFPLLMIGWKSPRSEHWHWLKSSMLTPPPNPTRRSTNWSRYDHAARLNLHYRRVQIVVMTDTRSLSALRLIYCVSGNLEGNCLLPHYKKCHRRCATYHQWHDKYSIK
ncbi:MAG: RloB domain-containing protein [Burkholderiales bacterium]